MINRKVQKSKLKVQRDLDLYILMGHLASGETVPEIQKSLNWPKSTIHYRINKLIEAGVVRRVSRSSMNFYELTDKVQKKQIGHLPKLNLHSIEFAYRLIEESENFQPDKEWQWGRSLVRVAKVSGCTAKLMGKTLVITVSDIDGYDAFKLQDEAKNKADSAAAWLRAQGFKLGPGRQTRKPHFAIIHPLMRELGKHLQIDSEDYQVDRSRTGEVEYFTPEMADEFMRMPERLSNLDSHLIKQTVIMDDLAANISLHLDVMRQIQTGLRSLTSAIGELRGAVKLPAGGEGNLIVKLGESPENLSQSRNLQRSCHQHGLACGSDSEKIPQSSQPCGKEEGME